MIRKATARDAGHLARFINMASDNLPLHLWQRMVGPDGDPWDYGQLRAAREAGSFSFRNAWLAEQDGEVAACLLGYVAEPSRAPISPETDPIFVPFMELEAMLAATWYLDVLATYPPFRGRGLATKLLEKAEGLARKAGCETISLIVEDTHLPRHLCSRRSRAGDGVSPST